MLLLLLVLGTTYTFYAYHVVQDEDGIHLLKKKNAEINFEIVDTRDWNMGDWLKNSEITKGLAEIRWENFRESAKEQWNELSESIEETFKDIKGEDSWTDDLGKEWQDLRDSVSEKYKELETGMQNGSIDRKAFDEKVAELRRWAERQMGELQDRLTK